MKIRVILTAIVMALGGLALALTSLTASAAPVQCAYYTTNGGVSAVALTSGTNCVNHPFTIKKPPYNGATFANYATFLEQIGEFVNEVPVLTPSQVAFIHHLPVVGSAKNVYTNGIPVYVYQDTGTNDGSADGFVDLIHGQYPWQ